MSIPPPLCNRLTHHNTILLQSSTSSSARLAQSIASCAGRSRSAFSSLDRELVYPLATICIFMTVGRRIQNPTWLPQTEPVLELVRVAWRLTCRLTRLCGLPALAVSLSVGGTLDIQSTATLSISGRSTSPVLSTGCEMCHSESLSLAYVRPLSRGWVPVVVSLDFHASRQRVTRTGADEQCPFA
ncbi:hypothetical protein F5148DRAFT_908457 [Russula earlei]|uniref:Uncharacterized protein n=1 Tax=Russula earlei TaxID=71964 RepID=A0ACC0U9P5_9AGAM|nr:hypothetical protein F5148DRAFT_908457 [Russula earlei]